jgi:hypothetical protein
MSSGFVYLFTNEAMPGIVKIGFSQTTLRERSKTLETTGVPKKFEIEFAISTLEPQRLEKMLHKHFRKYHYEKEFFKCDIAILVRDIKLFLENEKINYIDYEGRASVLYLTENDRNKIQKQRDQLEELKIKKNHKEQERKQKKLEDINIEKERQKVITAISQLYANDFEKFQLIMTLDYKENLKKYERTVSGKFKNRSKLWDLGIGLSTFFVGTYLLSKVDDVLKEPADEIAKFYESKQINLIKKFIELEREIIHKTAEYSILNKYEVIENLNRQYGNAAIYQSGPKKRRMPPDYRTSITEHFASFTYEFSQLVTALKIPRGHILDEQNQLQGNENQEDRSSNNKFEWELTEWGIKRNGEDYTIPISFISIHDSGVLINYHGDHIFIDSTDIKNFKER